MRSKTVMNPSRLRILEYFVMHGDATAAEIQAELCDIPTASLYRHINVLAEDGWLELASERRVRGATERRYKLVATNIPDAPESAATEALLSLLATFKGYFAKEDADPERDMLCFSTSALMLSDEEFSELLSEQRELIRRYIGKEPDKNRKPRRITYISSPCEEEE